MATFDKRIGSSVAALLAGALATSLWSLPVAAQEPAPPPPPEAAPAPETPAALASAQPPIPTPPPAVEGSPAAVVTEKPPANQHKKMDPPAIWFRLDNKIQNPDDPKKLNKFQSGAEVDVLFSGQVHEYVSWQADFVATLGTQTGPGKSNAEADILDLIGKFDIHDAFHVWLGRMLVPSDRSNFSGPWFMSPWNYPGVFPGGYGGPRQGDFGRNDGATVWGQFLGGHLKYYAGAFDLHDVKTTALLTGRLNFTLLNPEDGYYHSSTYYGTKDIVALGIGGQYKKNGSVEKAPTDPPPMGFVGMTDNYSEINADLLVEKKLGNAGTVDFEAAFYKFIGDFEPIDNSFYVLASYLFPSQIGIGRLQPLVRFQQATPKPDGGKWRLIDAAISYVVDEYAMRIALNYQNQDFAGLKGNAVQLGIQIQK